MKIVLSTLVAMFLLGCGEDKASHNVQTEEKKVTPQEVVATPALKKVVEAKIETPLQKQVQNQANVVSKPVVEKTVAKPIEKKIVSLKAPTKEIEAEKTVVSSIANEDGKALFAKCTACHGQNAQKKALNKSQVIRGWSSEKVVNALHGYKDGTYGGSMKGVMKAQVSNLTDKEVKAVATYISTL